MVMCLGKAGDRHETYFSSWLLWLLEAEITASENVNSVIYPNWLWFYFY